MENDNDDEHEKNIELNYKRAKYFLENNSIVHLSLKNGNFYNGRLFEVGSDFVIIHDRKIGNTLVFFMELKKPIQEYLEDEK